MRTRVSAPGCSRKIPGADGSSNVRALSGIHRSCVPQPSSAGCNPSEMNPSTDQVFQNVSIGLGARVRCVSRSAMWMPCTPAARMYSAHPARSPAAGSTASRPRSPTSSTSASFTNHDTMPGFAPQHDTAVVPPGERRCSSVTVERSAWFVLVALSVDGS